MNWLKRSTFEVSVALLFVTLLGAVVSASLFAGIGNQQQTKQWFKQSGIYDQLVTNAINKAQESSTFGADSAAISLKDPAVQKIARSVYSPQFVQGRVETFIDSNYSWLQGKTAAPKFKIDLTDTKQMFADTVGKNVQTYLTGLKACTPEQLAQLQASSVSSPLTVACRPANLDPKTEATRITQQIANGPFIDNPVITADTVSSDYGVEGSKPYYKTYANAPQMYRALHVAPFLFALVSLLLMMALVFLGVTKRAAVHRIGFVFLLAGIVLVLIKFVADYVLNKVEDHVFTNQNATELQAPLTSIVHNTERAIARIDVYAGLLFILIGCALLVLIGFINKRHNARHSRRTKPFVPPSVSNDMNTSSSADNYRQDSTRSSGGAVSGQTLQGHANTPTAPLIPLKTKKRPSKRLIQ